NHILSCGRDFLWRRRAAAIVAQWKPGKVVDLATGTGDLALAIQRVLPKSEVIGVDFAEEMLALARTKGVRQTIAADVLAQQFPGGEELLRLIEGNGFRDAVAESLTGGIVTIYTAKKNG